MNKIFVLLTSWMMAGCFMNNLPSPSLSKNNSTHYESAKAFQLNQSESERFLTQMTRVPHPFGSEAEHQLSTFIENEVNAAGLKSTRQTFAVDASKLGGPYQILGSNIIAWSPKETPPPCLIGIASHYDSKNIGSEPYVGANDSGSSSTLLLPLIKHLNSRASEQVEASPKSCGFFAVWFDGQETLPQADNLPEKDQEAWRSFGSKYFTSQLKSCGTTPKSDNCVESPQGLVPLSGIILFNMIGSKRLALTKDLTSTTKMVDRLKSGLNLFGGSNLAGGLPRPVKDDHTAFLQRGIPSLILLDFNNLQHWHKPSDKIDTISYENIELVGKIGAFVALESAFIP